MYLSRLLLLGDGDLRSESRLISLLSLLPCDDNLLRCPAGEESRRGRFLGDLDLSDLFLDLLRCALFLGEDDLLDLFRGDDDLCDRRLGDDDLRDRCLGDEDRLLTGDLDSLLFLAAGDSDFLYV